MTTGIKEAKSINIQRGREKMVMICREYGHFYGIHAI